METNGDMHHNAIANSSWHGPQTRKTNGASYPAAIHTAKKHTKPQKSQRISGDLMPNSRNCNVARDYRCPITLPRHPSLQLRAPTNFLLLLLSISFLSPNFWLFSPLFQQNFIIAACQTPPSLSPLWLRAPAGPSIQSEPNGKVQSIMVPRENQQSRTVHPDGWMDRWMVSDQLTIFSWVSVH